MLWQVQATLETSPGSHSLSPTTPLSQEPPPDTDAPDTSSTPNLKNKLYLVKIQHMYIQKEIYFCLCKFYYNQTYSICM